MEICDVCKEEVGELQLTKKKDGYHFCFSCSTISWVVKELLQGKDFSQNSYQREGAYKFDYEKLIKVLLEEATKQIKNGKYETDKNR